MAKILYRAILHGPMSWKASNCNFESNDTTPYLVIFEPTSSVVMLSQGTILIPQLSLLTNKLKSQILSVFLFSDSSTAKQLVSELYNYIDKNMSLFDIYKSERVLKLLAKSLSSFHLPLEIVLKRVECSQKNKNNNHNTSSYLNYYTAFKNNTSSIGIQGVRSVSRFPLDCEPNSYNNRINSHLNYLFYNDPKAHKAAFTTRAMDNTQEGRLMRNRYAEEPRSVRNLNDLMDSYSLRVGLEEGFNIINSSTDLIQKLFQSVERKGPKINRLSLNFYKITRADPKLDPRLNNSVLKEKLFVNTGKEWLNGENKKLAPPMNTVTASEFSVNCIKTPIRYVEPSDRYHRSPIKCDNEAVNLDSYGLISDKYGPNLRINRGFYTPGQACSPLSTGLNLLDKQPNLSTINRANKLEKDKLVQKHGEENESGLPSLTNILRSLTNAIDKNTEAISLHGPSGLFSADKVSSSILLNNQTNQIDSPLVKSNQLSNQFPNLFPEDSNCPVGDNKPKGEKNKLVMNTSFGSMSTNDFLSFDSQASINNPKNLTSLDAANFGSITDSLSDNQLPDFNDKLAGVKLDDLQLKPFNKTRESFSLFDKSFFNDSSDLFSDKRFGESSVDNLKLNKDNKTGMIDTFEPAELVDSEADGFADDYADALEKASDSFTKTPNKELCDVSMAESNTNPVNKNQDYKNELVEDKESHMSESPPESDNLSDFSENSSSFFDDELLCNNHVLANKMLQKCWYGAKRPVKQESKETKTTEEEDEESLTSGNPSERSELNDLLDEFNELTNKNDLLHEEITRYKGKISKLKQKIKNMKSMHKYELEDLVNNNFSSEEKLRTTINENNVTITMMEQERIKLNETLEQHKMVIKRLGREKIEAVQQFSKLEDEYNKLQISKEMEKNEKNNYNKLKVQAEDLKSENEVLSNKVRSLNEKLHCLELDHQTNLELVSELKESNVQLTSENKLLSSNEHQLSDEIKMLRSKEHQLTAENKLLRTKELQLLGEVKVLRTNEVRLTEELRRTKLLLTDYQNKTEKFESKMSILENNNTVLLKNLESTKTELGHVKASFETSNSEKLKLETKYQQLQSSVEKVESMNNSLRNELMGVRNVLEDKTKDNIKLTSRLSDKDKEVNKIKKDRNDIKDNYDTLLRDYNYLRTSYEAVEISLKKFKNFDESLRREYQIKSDENEELLRQLQAFKYCVDKFKSDNDLREAKLEELHSKAVARLFWVIYLYNKTRKELALSKIKNTLMAHKNNSVLVRSLIRSVLLSKGKLAKRNCQLLRVIHALQMTGPTTCSMIISKINTLVASTSDNSLSEEKVTKLKDSFMKHSLEKDQMIKVLQTKLVSLDQLKENQDFLLQENRNLSDQIMIEQNNSQRIQQALNEQIERERFTFESESKSLYNRQYQLLRENDQLSREISSLKESLNALLHSDNSQYRDFNSSNHDQNVPNQSRMRETGLIEAKYERLLSIYNSSSQNLGTKLHSPETYKDHSEFDFSLRANTNYPRMIYHQT
uniref:Uncharacterized protein n=1 Tax=Theileria annulata TaxID=5874 RepID=A0A3B0MS09_THEAN